MYNDNDSSRLKTSKYPKLALNFIIGELSKIIGITYKEFLELTLEETDILLEIVEIKQSTTSAIHDIVEEEQNKSLNEDMSGDPFFS